MGRLDADVTGLLVLTDDGTYAHRVASPKAEIPKTYEVHLDSPLKEEDAERLSRGVVWSDGTAYRPASLEPMEGDPCAGFVTVTEGKYHEVKRLMAACGHTVVSMRRLSIGGLCLDASLPEGMARPMTAAEANLVFYKNVEATE